MTVLQLQQRLSRYPLDAKVLIFRAPLRHGVDIQDDVIETFVRPDFETVPSSILLVPKVK
jgi:hypothetical protein